MALAISLLTADPDSSNVASFATPSVSPTGASALLAFVLNTDGTNAIQPTFTSAFSIREASWTNQGTILAAASVRRYTLFTATAANTPGSGAGTADFAGDAQTGCTIWIVQVTGQAPGTTDNWFRNFGTNEGGGAGATSLTLTLPNAMLRAENMMVCSVMHNTAEDQSGANGGNELASSDVSYTTPATQGGIYHATNDNSIGASWATSSAKLSIGGEINAAIPSLMLRHTLQPLYTRKF